MILSRALKILNPTVIDFSAVVDEKLHIAENRDVLLGSILDTFGERRQRGLEKNRTNQVKVRVRSHLDFLFSCDAVVNG